MKVDILAGSVPLNGVGDKSSEVMFVLHDSRSCRIAVIDRETAPEHSGCPEPAAGQVQVDGIDLHPMDLASLKSRNNSLSQHGKQACAMSFAVHEVWFAFFEQCNLNVTKKMERYGWNLPKLKLIAALMQHAWMRPSLLAATPPKSPMVHRRVACIDLVCDDFVHSSARPKAGICSTLICRHNPGRYVVNMKDVRPARSRYRTSATSDVQIQHATETG